MHIKIMALIPVYNHAETLAKVVAQTLQYLPVIVVDDGSTDLDLQSIKKLDITYIQHQCNLGKGAAILTGIKTAKACGATHVITLDADAQHQPQDIPLFLQAIHANHNALIIGARDFSVPNIPFSSVFGRKFSEFWMYLQTGVRINDMQSGFRAYPVKLFDFISCTQQQYAFEIEVVVKVAWAGFTVKEIPIQVYYPPAAERKSHFLAIRDNWRISVLNTKLTIRALLPIPFKCHALDPEGRISILKPLQSLQYLLQKQALPWHLAYSGAISILISTLPIPGLQSLLLLFCISSLKLNRLCALAVIPLTWPPFLPGFCILVGYFLRHGQWLTEFSIQTLGYEAGQRVWEWILGALFLAPVLGLIFGVIIWILAQSIVKYMVRTHEMVE